jgi:hypothetical protein
MKARLVLLCLWAAAALGTAQETPAPARAQDVWVLRLHTPAREYAVRLGSLQTVTLQDYDMRREGKIRRVVEMTVETVGGNRARFFWEDNPRTDTPLTGELAEKQREVEKAVRELSGQNEEGKAERVVKDYPATTHGAWTEFALSREQEVRDLHRQLMEMWTGAKRPD